MTEISLVSGTVFLAFQTRDAARAAADEAKAGQLRGACCGETSRATAKGDRFELESGRGAGSAAHWFDYEPQAALPREPGWCHHRIGSIHSRSDIGPGVALNIEGKLQFPPPSGVYCDFALTALAPGETEIVNIARDNGKRIQWQGVTGEIRFSDMTDAQWVVTFEAETSFDQRPQRLVIDKITFLGRQRDASIGYSQ